MLRVDEHTVSAWEKNSQPPTPANLQKIRQFLKAAR